MRTQHFILIRHGQASFGKDNYDQLSPLGCEQMKILGSLFQETTGLNLDLDGLRFHVGQLQRQQDSLQHFLDHAQWIQESERMVLHKQTYIDRHWNEFEFKKILEIYQHKLQEEPQTDFMVSQGGIYAFHFLISRWILGVLPSHDIVPIPTWNDFQSQIIEHIQSIITQAQDQQELYHVCFSSAGVITAIISHFTHMNPMQSLAFLMKVKNSSVTHFSISLAKDNAKFSIKNLNNTKHLHKEKTTLY